MFKRVLITAALPYANGTPHLGHMKSTYLPADILARFYKLKGVKTLYVCATDEHGTPIQLAAEEAGEDAEEFVKKYHELGEKIFKSLNIEFDIFYRTHSPENKELTQMFLKSLRENDYIYEKTVELYYCPACHRYLPDRYVKGTCPKCGAEDQYSDYCEKCGTTFEVGEILEPKCAICGSTPILKKSLHFIFKLSAFSNFLEEWLKNNKELQPQVVNYVLKWIEEGLKDWDITREKDYWGFELPYEDAEGKKVYVWFDAPIGYIASTVKWCKDHGDDWEKWWKDSETKIIHHIGKDIIYHHYLFWPAMLKGTNLGFNLPSAIPTRGFLTLEKRKFSKSRQWYISVEDFLKYFPADYARFYLTLASPLSLADTDWSWSEFKEKINNDLVGTIGNFIHRVLTLIYRYFQGKVPEPSEYNKEEKRLINHIKREVERIEKLMETYRLKLALEAVINLAREGNKYLNLKEPWKAIKINEEDAKTTLYVAIQLVKIIAILLIPFIPESAKKILNYLNIEGRYWDYLKKADISPNHLIKKPDPVFRKVSDREIEDVTRLLKLKK